MSFVGVGALAANATTATLTIVAPTLQADDIMVAAVLAKSDVVLDPPDGTWTEFVQAMNTTAQKVVLWWKRAAAGDSGASFNFLKDIDDNILFCGVISAWRGRLKTGDPLAGSSTSANASSDTVSYASLDPTAACDLVAVGFYNEDLTTAGSISGTDPTFVNRWDLETALGTDGSIFGYSGDSTGAATGARSHSTTSTVDAISIGVLFGLLPEPEADFAGSEVRRRTLRRWRFPRRAPWPAVEFEPAVEVVDFDAGGGLVHAARRRTFSGWKFRAGVRPGGVEFEGVEEPAAPAERRPLSEYVKFELGHRQGVKFDRR